MKIPMGFSTCLGMGPSAGSEKKKHHPLDDAFSFGRGYEKDIIADFAYGFELLLLLIALCSIYGCD